KPMVLGGELGPLGLMVSRDGATPKPIAFSISPESLKMAKGAGEGEVKLVGEDGYGLRVTQTLRFHADSYVVDHDIRVENQHSVAQRADVSLTWMAPVEWPKGKEPTFQGQHPVRGVKVASGHTTREDLAKL